MPLKTVHRTEMQVMIGDPYHFTMPDGAIVPVDCKGVVDGEIRLYQRDHKLEDWEPSEKDLDTLTAQEYVEHCDGE
eukprot:COSAG06_NODE_65418_length_257_cov_0.639241_1_plen_75_part_10